MKTRDGHPNAISPKTHPVDFDEIDAMPMAVMSFPQSSAEVTHWCMLIVSIVCFVAALCAAAPLVKAKYTGTANYYPSIAAPATLQMTSAKDPRLFQQAMIQAAFPAVLAGSVSAAAFYFYRRLSV